MINISDLVHGNENISEYSSDSCSSLTDEDFTDVEYPSLSSWIFSCWYDYGCPEHIDVLLDFDDGPSPVTLIKVIGKIFALVIITISLIIWTPFVSSNLTEPSPEGTTDIIRVFDFPSSTIGAGEQFFPISDDHFLSLPEPSISQQESGMQNDINNTDHDQYYFVYYQETETTLSSFVQDPKVLTVSTWYWITCLVCHLVWIRELLFIELTKTVPRFDTSRLPTSDSIIGSIVHSLFLSVK